MSFCWFQFLNYNDLQFFFVIYDTKWQWWTVIIIALFFDIFINSFNQLIEKNNHTKKWIIRNQLSEPSWKKSADWIKWNNHSSLSFIPSEHSVAAKTGGCFPGDAQVVLEGGVTKQMRDLHPGDRVLASSTTDGHGPLLYSPVLSFVDRQPNVTKIFYIIGTDRRLNITLTAAHLIFVTDCTAGLPEKEVTAEEPLWGSVRGGRPSREAGLRTVFASEVQPGQCVLTSQGKVDSQATLSVVTFVEEQRNAGLYAPLTQHGSIVVNGVLASCYAAVDSHRLAHWVLAPLRFFYSLMGPSEPQTDGLHWYPRLLQRLGQTLLDAGHFHPWGIEQVPQRHVSHWGLHSLTCIQEHQSTEWGTTKDNSFYSGNVFLYTQLACICCISTNSFM